jgi:hypothetical protein
VTPEAPSDGGAEATPEAAKAKPTIGGIPIPASLAEYHGDPAVFKAVEALDALDYNRRLLFYRHILPRFDPRSPTADLRDTNAIEKMSRDERQELRDLIDQVDELDVELDDLQPVDREAVDARP